MKLVFICSPYSGDIVMNTLKAKRYCRFAYTKGTTPFAPHLHNPQFLDENIPQEREDGIDLGLEVLKRADALWVFGERISAGMTAEITAAKNFRIPIKYFTDTCVERDSNELFQRRECKYEQRNK